MSSVRQLLHVLVAVAAWAVFGFMWFWVFRNSGPVASQVESLVTVVVMALLVVAVTGLWVAHNVRRWKRGDRREHPACTGHDYSADACGRAVDGDFAALDSARFIEIDVVEGASGATKRYAAPAGMDEPSDQEAAACVA